MIGKVLYHALTSDEEIASFIEDRVYPNRPPQGVVFPCILYKTQSVSSLATQDGSIHAKEVLVLAVIAESDDIVFELADKVTDLLHFYEGTVETTTIDFMTFQDYQDDVFDEAGNPYRELTFNVLSTISKS